MIGWHNHGEGVFGLLPGDRDVDADVSAKANMGSRCPFRRERLGLLQDVEHGGILQVGRIAVFAQ
jgi:hypothetical protein